MTVSQFVLQTALPVPEEIVNRDIASVQALFRLEPAAWDVFGRLLNSPVREIPELRELLTSRPPWES